MIDSRSGERFRTPLVAVARVAASYLIAAVVETTVFSLARGGHADVPFTRFPEALVMAPVAPVLIVQSVLERFAWLEAACTASFVAVLALSWVALRRRGVSGAARET